MEAKQINALWLVCIHNAVEESHGPSFNCGGGVKRKFPYSAFAFSNIFCVESKTYIYNRRRQ